MYRKIGVVLTLASLVCVSCSSDDGPPDTPTNNATNNTTTPTNNTTNNTTNNVPGECTAEFQYDDWRVNSSRRFIKACSPYIANTSIEVSDGATLTIDAGVEVRVPAGEWLRVDGGKIVAQGEADDPIVFTSTESSPGPGSWLGLRISPGAESGNVLSHAVIEYGGQEGFGTEACLTVEPGRAGRLSLTDVTFSQCARGGLASADAVFTAISGLVFENIDGFGVALGADAVGSVTEAFSYDGVSYNRISTEPVTKSATWISQGIPYRVATSIDVASDLDPVLRLEPGVHLQFGTSQWLRVGANGDGGLIAAGTAARPVILESNSTTDASGAWLGVRFDGAVITGTSLSSVIVRHAGQEGFGTLGCVSIATSASDRIAITDSRFEQCAGAGVAADAPSFGFTAFTGNTFRTSAFGMHLPPNAVSTVGPQTYDGVLANRIRGASIERPGTWVAQDVPWNVTGSIDVGGQDLPQLTLEAGVELRFTGGEWLRIGSLGPARLVVQGTAARPVVLQSSQAAPAAGDWLGIAFEGDVLGGTEIDYLTIRHAGREGFATGGCVSIATSEPGRIGVTNSLFEQCGIAAIGAAAQGFEFRAASGNTFRDTPYGFAVPPSAIASIDGTQTYAGVPANHLRGGTLGKTSTWANQGVPWEVTDSVDVNSTTTTPILTIEAGNEFRFAAGQWLRIGANGAGGIMANGTAADVVRFTSKQPTPAPGSWLGLNFASGTANGSVLNNIRLDFAGENAFGQRGGVTLANTGSALTIRNSMFDNNAQVDIFVDSQSSPILMNVIGNVGYE